MTVAEGGPRIGVVVVHYGTDELTLRCLRALLDDAASPPTEVVLVDNGPGAGVAPRVRTELPGVRVIAPGRNTGFAGGCNLGIAALSDRELVALVNSDAVVGAGWLTPLLRVLDDDPLVGAVVPKVVYDGQFHELTISACRTWRPGRGDGRQLAWQLRRVEVGGQDVTGRCHLLHGFWEPGRGGRWAGERAVLRIPAVEGATNATVVLGTPPGQAVELDVGDGAPRRVAPGEGTCTVPLPRPALCVVNNVGNEWRSDGYGLDRGYQEVDRGQYDEPTEVPAWCGGAVLLRAAYLHDVGTFDERLFLYYEDLELSRRGAARGWRYRCEPAAVVQHRHGASAGGDAFGSERLKERNRLLVVARHDGLAAALRQLVRFVLVTASYLRREMVAPILRGAPPCGWQVTLRVQALRSALAGLPGMWASGRRDRRREPGRGGGMRPLA